jgi:23S rRNA pseudouridine1911/1915/1917 synthase
MTDDTDDTEATNDADGDKAASSAQPQRITVTETGRADKELARHFPEAGRKQLAELFDDGVVRVKGKRIKKGDFIAAGDVIELSRAPVSRDATRPQPDPSFTLRRASAASAPADSRALVVLLERADILVIDKPAGVPSQPLRAGELGTIANALAHHFPECASIGDDPRDGGLVHRLDIGTSGVLVAARTPEAYRALRDAFGDKLVEKSYLAITEGRPVSRDSDAPLVQRGKKVIVDQTDGLAAYTAFTVESSWTTTANGRTTELALVRCSAQTGRMHQIRAHLAHLAAPILGDTLYGGSPHEGGFFLHASSIAFDLGGERIEVTSPTPARFEAVLQAHT